jgi:hypothetical protein
MNLSIEVTAFGFVTADIEQSIRAADTANMGLQVFPAIIFVCVDYRDALTGLRHTTAFVYRVLTRTNEKNPL